MYHMHVLQAARVPRSLHQPVCHSQRTVPWCMSGEAHTGADVQHCCKVLGHHIRATSDPIHQLNRAAPSFLCQGGHRSFTEGSPCACEMRFFSCGPRRPCISSESRARARCTFCLHACSSTHMSSKACLQTYLTGKCRCITVYGDAVQSKLARCGFDAGHDPPRSC